MPQYWSRTTLANGLLHEATKPLREAMLILHWWSSVVFTSVPFHSGFSWSITFIQQYPYCMFLNNLKIIINQALKTLIHSQCYSGRADIEWLLHAIRWSTSNVRQLVYVITVTAEGLALHTRQTISNHHDGLIGLTAVLHGQITWHVYCATKKNCSRERKLGVAIYSGSSVAESTFPNSEQTLCNCSHFVVICCHA